MKLLTGLNSCKATGLDGLPAKFIIDSAESIVKPLTYIVNLSIESGAFPDDLKRAKIVPIYKKKAKPMCLDMCLCVGFQDQIFYHTMLLSYYVFIIYICIYMYILVYMYTYSRVTSICIDLSKIKLFVFVFVRQSLVITDQFRS